MKEETSRVRYKFSVEQCDVAPRSRRRLERYRAFKAKLLEKLHGNREASVMSQVHDLAWDTAVFQTMNEARRLEPDRPVNGAMWDLLTNGYVSRMVLGIRRVVDHGEATTGLRAILKSLRTQHELLTREHYVCHDGLPFDPVPVRDSFYESNRLRVGQPSGFWLESEGPGSFATSERAHDAFDKLCEPSSGVRRRDERMSLAILDKLEAALDSPETRRVKALADKRLAHSEHLSPRQEEKLQLTFNDLEEALKQVVGVANFISANVLFDTAIGSVVPTAQYNQLEHLDSPWSSASTIPALHAHWTEVEARLNKCVYDDGQKFRL